MSWRKKYEKYGRRNTGTEDKRQSSTGERFSRKRKWEEHKKESPSVFVDSSESRRKRARPSAKSDSVFVKPLDDSVWERESGALSLAVGSGVAQYSRHHYKSVSLQRRLLPVFAHRSEILGAVLSHRVVVVVGDTGSGKSTQIAQYLYESGWAAGGRMVGCTQPRRICATAVASRIAHEMDCAVGQALGYALRFDHKVGADTGVKLLTDGMLLSEVLIDPLLSQYSVVVIDEAHERSVATDLLFGVLFRIMAVRLDLRVVICSATLDALKFKRFFEALHNCCVVPVSGRMFPVEVFYRSQPVRDYVKACVETAVEIHATEAHANTGDILVFLTGEAQIHDACAYCKELLHRNESRDALVLPMFAGLPFAAQLSVFKRAKRGVRKMIFSTNVAETSVTIDGVVFVIDSGYVKQRAFDPRSGVASLIVTHTSQACAEQRKGRGGRLKAGKCYRMYTERHSDEMQKYDSPQIQRVDLTSAILKLKALGIDNVDKFEFIDKPSKECIEYSMELLRALKAVEVVEEVVDSSKKSGRKLMKLTSFGRVIAQIPTEPLLAAALVGSAQMGCCQEMLSIAAMLSVRRVWQPPRGSRKQIESKLQFSVSEGDHVTYLNVFNSFVLNGCDSHWCKQNHVHFESLKRATQIRALLRKYLTRFGLPIVSCNGDVSAILRAVVSGFFRNAAQLQSDGYYRSVRGAQRLEIHPSSVLYQSAANWVVFSQIVQADDSVFMHDVSVLKPQWLQQIAPHFYRLTLTRHR